MGFFGVSAAAGDKAPLEIERCHLNLWTLGGLFGYRVCCLDVGLHIQAGDQPIEQISLGLPVSTDETPEKALDSLQEEMGNPTIAGLIFARENVVRNSCLRLDDEDGQMRDVPIVGIDRPRCQLAPAPRDKHFSLWTLQLSPEIAPRSEGYLRVRFHIRGAGRLWLWQRSLLARDAAIVDLRISDEREAQSVADISGFTERLLPLKRVNAFVIAPASFRPSVTTPEPSYVRGLEGSVWDGYLGRRTDLRRNQKFLVHRWAKDGITRSNPFRGFIQLERRRSLLPSWGDLMPVLLALLLAAALFELELRDLDWLCEAGGAAGTFLFAGLPAPAGLYAVLAVIGALVALRSYVRSSLSWLRGLRGRIDRAVYTRLPRHG